MTPQVLADGFTTLEHSAAIGKIAALLGLVVLGYIGLTLLHNLVQRVEFNLQRMLPTLAVLAFVGAVVAGLLHYFKLW